MDGKDLPMAGFLTRLKALHLIDAVLDYVDDQCR